MIARACVDVCSKGVRRGVVGAATEHGARSREGYWRGGVVVLGGLEAGGIRCGLGWGRGSARELSLTGGRWGGIEAGSFATLRMTDS